MRIAYFTETYPPEINGVALTVKRSVDHLRECGHVVDLVRPRRSRERPGACAEGWLVPGCSLPMYPEVRFGWALPSMLAQRFAQARPDLVHVATPGPLCCAAVSAARKLGIAATSDFRTNFHQYARYYRLGWLEPTIGGYLRWFHNRTDCSFVPTQSTRACLQREGFEGLAVVGRGVDLERFSPDRRSAALRSQWGARDGPVLLHVGRLAAEKNVELALRAARLAAERVPGARMVVVGDGPRRRALEREFPEALFVGLQTGTALAAHYASADLFLFPSLSDTFGNVTLEALASGLPVLAFDVAAASDFVTDELDGRLIEPGDDAAFIDAACRLAASTQELAAMRPHARKAALGATWPTVLAKFEQRLKETVDAQQRARYVAECVA
jgi:glycosyltransferase involved in cell wall biosynthesis